MHPFPILAAHRVGNSPTGNHFASGRQQLCSVLYTSIIELHRRPRLPAPSSTPHSVELITTIATALAACGPAVLIQAHVARAPILAIATPDTFQAPENDRDRAHAQPALHVVVRSHSEGEAELLRREQAVEVLAGELELANGMVRRVCEYADARS